MEIKTIGANLLPDISSDIRIRVGLGRWSMYEIKYPENKDIHYMLSTEKRDYLLNSTGRALSVLQKRTGIKYLSRISFVVSKEINFIDISK